MRTPRFALAGLLLFAAASLLTALFAQPTSSPVGATTPWQNVVVHIGRTPLVLAAGLLLWASVLILTGLLGQDRFPSASSACAVFVPLWVLLCVVNATIGVLSAGYTVLEELPVLAFNVAVPTGVALFAWRRAQHNQTEPNKS